ncbi:phage Gp37/Gp68 family protein [Ensifer adhaerens]|uniref:phage Gp37/Gp68 family protein n=1 Tax=Ensifer adhaerens TaxID=106592 RepID=UPI001CBD7284|nr:phage Gp37/Gp68 family protein [Ensifer adhaerens]MBZ7923139.1 phage Gp37/Gp68 family protein [Ensifer adhaerens]UAX91726.1 phage Gp37/Gp68 family protein [Ensifer adhaerens]UAX99354.1 phage Gp37/Gp68 family protein [Ensifer adhaerens]UAY06737.1 phage Gp37/Gp68 family protein [Ensifer adhaerens]
MADGTKIEWTDATWNPVTGCSVVSPGCTNCYAMKLAGTRLNSHPSREGLTRDTKGGPVWTGEVRFNPQWLDEPLRWRKPRMIFVCAHGDLFAEGVPDEWIDQVFAIMSQAPQHTFQVLTKRPERMRSYLTRPRLEHHLVNALLPLTFPMPEPGRWPHRPLPNVWLGVSVEDQKRAAERIPILLDTPAAIRWISAEPLLGPVDLTRIDQPNGGFGPYWINALKAGESGWFADEAATVRTEPDPLAFSGLASLDWIVAGGESGSDARPMHPVWARSLRDQCAAAGVPFLFKQWGSWKPICEMPAHEVNGCYRSNRKACADEDQAIIDEMHGTTCLVEQTVLHHDASRHDYLSPGAFADRHSMTMYNIGKKAAGRLLDGDEHNGFPNRKTRPQAGGELSDV